LKKQLTSESLFALRSFILAAFFSLKPLSPLTGKPFSPSVIKTLIFSYRNRRRSIKISEASQAAGVNPRQLERRLRREIGMGFHTWHNGERIALTKERLNVYGDTPDAAMREAGFGKFAYSQFSHVFKAWIRMCPREFQRMCQEETTSEGRLNLQIYAEKYKEFQDLIVLVHEGKATWRQKVKAVYEEKTYRRGALVPPEYSTGET